MSRFGSNDYDDFLKHSKDVSELEELLEKIVGAGVSTAPALLSPGIINDRYEIIRSGPATILYDRKARQRVFISPKSRRVLADKISNAIEGMVDRIFPDECTDFLIRSCTDVDYLRDLEVRVSGEIYIGTPFEGKIDIGRVNDQYELLEVGDDLVLVDNYFDGERFNISEYGVDNFLSTLKDVMRESYCHGFDYDTYCSFTRGND